MNLKLFSLLSFFLIFSCQEKPHKKSFIDGDDLIPPNEEDSSLFGIDSDQDGVRDDVEIWINKEYEDPNQRKAAKSLAKLHAKMWKQVDNHEVFFRLYHRDLQARESCFMFVHFDKMLTGVDTKKKELYEKIYNHASRRLQYKKGLRSFPSGSYRIASVPLHEYGTGCDFKISNYMNYIEAFKSKSPRYIFTNEVYEEIKDMYEVNPDKYRNDDKFAIKLRSF